MEIYRTKMINSTIDVTSPTKNSEQRSTNVNKVELNSEKTRTLATPDITPNIAIIKAPLAQRVYSLPPSQI